MHGFLATNFDSVGSGEGALLCDEEITLRIDKVCRTKTWNRSVSAKATLMRTTKTAAAKEAATKRQRETTTTTTVARYVLRVVSSVRMERAHEAWAG